MLPLEKQIYWAKFGDSFLRKKWFLARNLDQFRQKPVLIRLVVGNVFKVNFSFWVMGLIDWAVNKKTQTMHTPPYRRLCNLSLWSSHVGNKSRILGKGYGGRMWCYWEHLGGTLGNVVNKLGA
jgi:hypothetical protein